MLLTRRSLPGSYKDEGPMQMYGND